MVTDAEVLVPQQTTQGIWARWQTRGLSNSGSGFTASTLGYCQQETGRFLRPTAIPW